MSHIETPRPADDSVTVQLGMRPPLWLLNALEEEARLAGFRSPQALIVAILKARHVERTTKR